MTITDYQDSTAAELASIFDISERQAEALKRLFYRVPLRVEFNEKGGTLIGIEGPPYTVLFENLR